MRIMKGKRKWLLLIIMPALLAGSFFAYVSDGYKADEMAIKALASDEVIVEKTDYGWSVSTTNLIKDLYFGESKSEEIRGPFQTQFYTGCGIQLPFIQFGVNAAYNFQSRKYSGAFIANLKI